MRQIPIFLDTSYVFALFNTRDQWHSRSLEWQLKIDKENTALLTTEFILTEIGDGLSSVALRPHAASIIRTLRNSNLIEIVPVNSLLFQRGLKLFEDRGDKTRGITDCTSFVTMGDFGLTEALTSDDDFRQAGFRALMLE